MGKNPYSESNFRIQTGTNGQGFFVRSDSERFGNKAIVFHGISYDECLQYIEERVDSIEPSYYVIKDLASWRRDVWRTPPERSEVERFGNVEDAIARFNEYRTMGYLKEQILEPYTKTPMQRLALGVSYAPYQKVEMDVLRVVSNEVLLVSDAVDEREYGYDRFMVNRNFIRDLGVIISSIKIDMYLSYRNSKMAFDKLYLPFICK